MSATHEARRRGCASIMRSALTAELIHRTPEAIILRGQFLASLGGSRAAGFDLHLGRLRWDEDRIGREGNDRERWSTWMVRRLKHPVVTKARERFCRCLRSHADFRPLALLPVRRDVKQAVSLCVEAGVVLIDGVTATIAQDRVRRPTMRCITAGARNAMHLEIGKALVEGWAAGQSGTNLDIATQLNAGKRARMRG